MKNLIKVLLTVSNNILNQIFQRLSSVFLYTLPLKASIPFGINLFYKYSFLKLLLFITFCTEDNNLSIENNADEALEN